MAINKNHEFEEVNGIKCAVVEKNVSAQRLAFLQPLLAYNGYQVVVQPSPPPKAAAAPVTDGAAPADALSPQPETFTVGVTDVMFNAVNAIFGRVLKTQDGHVVTLAYWKQEETTPRDDIPYYENVL